MTDTATTVKITIPMEPVSALMPNQLEKNNHWRKRADARRECRQMARYAAMASGPVDHYWLKTGVKWQDAHRPPRKSDSVQPGMLMQDLTVQEMMKLSDQVHVGLYYPEIERIKRQIELEGPGGSIDASHLIGTYDSQHKALKRGLEPGPENRVWR